jgi:uncharacterized membrane protein
MLAKVIRVTSVIVGGPLFAFSLVWLECVSRWSILGIYCNPSGLLALFLGATFLFWLCVPSGYLFVRVLLGKEK